MLQKGWMNGVKDIDGLKFLMTGDFNLGFLKSWNSECLSEFIHSNTLRNEQAKVIDTRKKQALKLLELTDSWSLSQKVTEGTRKANILDLVLTDSSDMIHEIDHIKHDKLTDHDTLVILI